MKYPVLILLLLVLQTTTFMVKVTKKSQKGH